MQKPAHTTWTATDLSDLGAIRVRGSDAVRFLQGQLSSDVTKLAADGPLLAGFHNPQGRVIALLRLVWLGPEDILAILPRELVPAVVARMGKFVLRAKVKLADDSANWRVTGIAGVHPAQARIAAKPLAICIDAAASRWWLIEPASESIGLASHAALDREGWRELDIAAGLPQVYAATAEAFVAQMLNLDELGAIAFDKGCYTGQEIIARSHYRGQVKRRMQRFQSAGLPRLGAGDSGQLPDGRAFKVVESVRRASGEFDFLAVAPLAQQESGGAQESS